MSVYTNDYIMSRDIDWFFMINGKYPIHASSFGGTLPKIINNREQNRSIQNMVWSVSEDDNNEYQLRNIPNDIQYDDQYAEDSIKENNLDDHDDAKRNYLLPFITMSVIGFYSFDREKLEDPTDNHYHLVSWPKHDDAGVANPVKIDPRIAQILPNIVMPDEVAHNMLEKSTSVDLVEMVERYSFANNND